MTVYRFEQYSEANYSLQNDLNGDPSVFFSTMANATASDHC